MRQKEMKARLRSNQARLKRPEAAGKLSLILSQNISANDFSTPERFDSLIHIYCEKRQNGILLEKRFPEAARADLERYLAHVLSEKKVEHVVELISAKSEFLGTLTFHEMPEVSRLIDILLWDRDDLWIFSPPDTLLAHLEFCEDEYLDPDVMDYRQPVFIVEHEN